jgi:glycosyltransferase involved in cell wall biosynthesis
MNRQVPKGVFISWVKFAERSRGISQALGIRDFYVERMKGTTVFLLPLRYLFQALETAAILWHERPKLIIAMNPPIVLPLLTYLAAKFLGAELVIDSHTGAFNGKWERLLFVHRFLSRRALATIVTNEPLRERVERWGAQGLILEDRIPDLEPSKASTTNKNFTVVAICSIADDEPIDEIIAAARLLPDFSFFVTGRVSPTLSRRLANLPTNLVLTGYLPRSDYDALLHRADALMVLVKQDFTLLCGAYEAVAVGKPLITSDWPVLRNYFSLGAVYVDNSPEGIRDGVRRVAQSRERLISEMQQLKPSLELNWSTRFQVLCSYIDRALGVTGRDGANGGTQTNPGGGNHTASRTRAFRNLQENGRSCA